MTPRRSSRLIRNEVKTATADSNINLSKERMKTPKKANVVAVGRWPKESVSVKRPFSARKRPQRKADSIEDNDLSDFIPKCKRPRIDLMGTISVANVRGNIRFDERDNAAPDDGEVIQSGNDSESESHQEESKSATASQAACITSSKTPASPIKAYHMSDHRENWNPKDPSHITAVKASLHLSAVPTSIICREEELKKVFEFCKFCIEKEKVGSMYVCGCPGTGKSLLLEKVKSLSTQWAKEVGILPPKSVVVSCNSLTNASDIFKKILEQWQGRKEQSSSNSTFQELRNLLCKKRPASSCKMTLLIVDEMDYLISKDQAVLYDLFKLPTLPNSNCMLIGISNAIDLTDRLLPKLQSLNCKPLVVTFRAYSRDQILKILQQRLMAVPYRAFKQEALELCARKVAAASGDMRKALHVCRNAIELFEAEMNDGSESDTSTIENPSLQEGETLTKPESNMVRIDHMARALAKTFRSAVVDTIQSLPWHQQVVLCSAVKCFRSGRKDANVGELHSAYIKFCKATSMCPLTHLEFSNICRVLSDQGLLVLGKSHEERLRRVSLNVDEADVNFAFQGIRFFKNSLQ